MADFSHLDAQIREAQEQFKCVTQTREERVLNLLSAYNDGPALSKVVHMLLNDEKYLQLERESLAALGKMNRAIAVPSGPFENNTREEAQLLRDENDLRADWGRKETTIAGGRQHYVMDVATKNGVGIMAAEELALALAKTMPVELETRQEHLVQTRGGYER